MIDFNDPRRRNYHLLDSDKLSVAIDIAVNIECLNDTLVYSVEPELERIAAALEKLAGIPAAGSDGAGTDKDEPAANTALTAVDEKIDAVLDVLNIVTGVTNPDTPFALRHFSDGTGRFLPKDKPAQTETPMTDE